MSFGIQLLVDARQVDTAKKSIQGLNALLEDMEKRKDVNMGGALAVDAEALRRASNEITKLGTLARTGENKGGLLNIQQWRDVDRLTKNIGGYLEGWTKQTAKMKADLSDVNARIADMNRAMSQHMSGKIRLSDSAINQIGDDLLVAGGQKERLQKELAARSKYDARANNLGNIAHGYGDSIGTFGTDTVNQIGKSIAGKVMSVMAWTASAVGVMSLAQFANKALQTYKQQEVGNAELANMGISGFRGGAYGYLYEDRKNFTENLARGTGSAAGALGFMGLARARNVDLGTMGGYASSLYQATGMRGTAANEFTASLMGTSNNTKQMVSILDGMAKLLKAQEQRQGALISGSQAAAMSGIFGLNFNKSPLLQSSALYDRANAQIASGGSNPGEQLYWWKMAGGDSYTGGFDQLLSIQAEQRKGIFSKTVRDNLRKDLAGKGRGQQLAMMQTMFGLNADPRDKNSEGALFLDNVVMNNIDFNDEEALRKALNEAGLGTSAEKIIKGIKGSKVLSNEQMKEEVASQAGHKAGPGILAAEGEIYKTLKNLMDGKKGALGTGLGNIWNSGWAGKALMIAGGGTGAYYGLKGGRGLMNAMAARSAGGAAGLGAASANWLKMLRWGTAAGVGADILLNASGAGGGYVGDDEAELARLPHGEHKDAAAKMRARNADKTGGVLGELQVISTTLAVILTLLSGVINIGGAKAEGTPK